MITRITRTHYNEYLVETNTVMTDGECLTDRCYLLDGKLVPAPGYFRVGGGIRVTLSPERLQQVLDLPIEDSIDCAK